MFPRSDGDNSAIYPRFIHETGTIQNMRLTESKLKPSFIMSHRNRRKGRGHGVTAPKCFVQFDKKSCFDLLRCTGHLQPDSDAYLMKETSRRPPRSVPSRRARLRRAVQRARSRPGGWQAGRAKPGRNLRSERADRRAEPSRQPRGCEDRRHRHGFSSRHKKALDL